MDVSEQIKPKFKLDPTKPVINKDFPKEDMFLQGNQPQTLLVSTKGNPEPHVPNLYELADMDTRKNADRMILEEKELPHQSNIDERIRANTRFYQAVAEKVGTFTELNEVSGRELGTTATALIAGGRQALFNPTANPIVNPLEGAGLSIIGVLSQRFLARVSLGERFGNAARLLVTVNNMNKGFWGAVHSLFIGVPRTLANRWILHNKDVADVLKFSGPVGEARLAEIPLKKKMDIMEKAAAAKAFSESVDIMTPEGAINWGRDQKQLGKFVDAGKVGERLAPEIEEAARTDKNIAQRLEKLPDTISNIDRWWYYQGVLGLALGSSLPAAGVAFGLDAIKGNTAVFINDLWTGAVGLGNNIWTAATGFLNNIWTNINGNPNLAPNNIQSGINQALGDALKEVTKDAGGIRTWLGSVIPANLQFWNASPVAPPPPQPPVSQPQSGPLITSPKKQ